MNPIGIAIGVGLWVATGEFIFFPIGIALAVVWGMYDEEDEHRK